jgi:hypothetical protein
MTVNLHRQVFKNLKLVKNSANPTKLPGGTQEERRKMSHNCKGCVTLRGSYQLQLQTAQAAFSLWSS